jgi:hypothetical protein
VGEVSHRPLRDEKTEKYFHRVVPIPEETLHHKDAQAWLRADVIEHYFEHAV